MFETKYSKFLTILLIIIIIGVVGLLGYIGYNLYEKYYIKKGASEYVDAFIGETDAEDTKENTSVAENENSDNTSLSEQVNAAPSGNTSTTTKKTKYNGFDVLGTIEIPATGVKYPVLAKVTTKSLNTSVAALYPENAELNTVGNVVIVGHNYRNGTFFSNNKKLKNGDKIYITDLESKKVAYTIYNIFETQESDTSFYNRDTNGAREITLSTCTDASNDMRLIVQAKAE